MYSMFLSRYRNTRESLGEHEKAVETQHFSFYQTCTRVSIKQLDYELEISIVWEADEGAARDYYHA